MGRAIVDRARELGWPPDRICVIDQDQGRSGASSVGREGFEQLVTAVSLGRAGAVFSLEASRLARSCSDVSDPLTAFWLKRCP
jgi:DNA invertase Pin-like site-specific DNA recombinase